jgi:hypothetical protein
MLRRISLLGTDEPTFFSRYGMASTVEYLNDRMGMYTDGIDNLTYFRGELPATSVDPFLIIGITRAG